LDDEISQIQDSLSAAKIYLSESHLNKLEKDGFFENKNGELLVSSINNKECVFAFFENSVAKCSLEKAFIEGKTNFRKRYLVTYFRYGYQSLAEMFYVMKSSRNVHQHLKKEAKKILV